MKLKHHFQGELLRTFDRENMLVA